MKLYQYPNCSTCRKASKFLTEQGIEFDVVHIVEQPPTRDELKTMLKQYDGKLVKLFNTSGKQYRELKLSEKLPSMSVDDAIDLLQSNGMLVKRPFLLTDVGKGVVGFKESTWETLL